MGILSISKFETWSRECEWNFENMLLLLQAEHQFATGRMTEAGYTYELAIASAKEHRFVHEEALSCELAGIFYRCRGMMEESYWYFQKAVKCYKSWGAAGKAKALLLSIEQDAPPAPLPIRTSNPTILTYGSDFDDHK